MCDEFYMQRCLTLAGMALGNTYPNPMVGCVIVHDGKIIGEGYHKKAGTPHAEIIAINSVENPALLPDATIYVSLEPCAHFGRTPPCAARLAEIGFKKVVIGASDPHDKVNGKGIEILKKAGIPVVTGVLADACEKLNKRFFTFHREKRPYIVLKWAQSADGFMDKDFQRTQVSNPLVNQFVHELRRHEHAILVGKKTALTDNPSLTVRAVSGRNPVRVLIDRDLSVPSDFALFDEAAETIVFNGIKENQEGKVTFIKTEKGDLLPQIMEQLYKRQIQSVLVEGGSFTLQEFLRHGLWDEAVVIKNNDVTFSGGTPAPKISQVAVKTENFRGNTVEYFKRSDEA